MSAGHALHPAHLRDLVEGSAIDPEVIAERDYYTLGRPEVGRPTESSDHLKSLGISRLHRSEPTRYPGLVLPIYDPTGHRVSAQWRPATPAKNPATGKPIKYASPSRQPVRLDVHPRWSRDPGLTSGADPAALPAIADPAVPLWITEGVKKADALTSRGACTVALSGIYNWRNTHGTLGDWEDVRLKGREVYICFDADAMTNAAVARAMSRFGKWLRSKGATTVRYVVPPAERDGTPTKGADDFFAAGGTLDELRARATARAPEPAATFASQFSDARMAEHVAEEVLDGRFIWTAGLGWLTWTGQRWRPVHLKVPLDAVRLWAAERHAEASKQYAAGVVTDKAIVAGWYTMLGAGRMRTALDLAAGVAGVLHDAADLDSDPDILNVANGIVNLCTGERGPHDPAALCTKLAPADYHPGAEHPDWKAALEAVRDDARSWLQLRYGQAVTGHMTPDDLLVVKQGGGSNGKTTIDTAIGAALGDYYGLLSDRVLLANPGDHPTELMDLRGLRVAVMEETPEARRLNVTRLKKIVGTPEITARRIAKDPVTFAASHGLFLSTNYLPLVEESDHGTWRRLALVRFPYTFRRELPEVPDVHDRAGDPGLRDRLRAGEEGRSEAVLAWLVQGAVAWDTLDRVMPALPASVVADTAAWRGEHDVVFAYIEERLAFASEAAVLATDLLADLNWWLKARGMHGWSEKLMASRFGEHEAFARVQKFRRRPADVSRPQGVWGKDRSGFDAGPPRLPTGPVAHWLGVRFVE